MPVIFLVHAHSGSLITARQPWRYAFLANSLGAARVFATALFARQSTDLRPQFGAFGFCLGGARFQLGGARFQLGCAHFGCV